jgi:hypothetical protein
MLHIDMPTEAVVRKLASHRERFSVSIYLQTSPIPNESDSARIELRNQVVVAADQLREGGASREAIEELEDAIADLIQDRQFWSYLSHTLVVFVTSGHVQTFRLPNRLPASVEVSDRLHIKPLVRAITFPQAGFVLALSQNAARLIELSAGEGAYTVDVADLPRDAASSVGLASISGRSPSGRIQGSEGLKVRLGQYSRAVDAAIRPIVSASGIPLILATTEPLTGIYRMFNNYPGLTEQTIDGNPDDASDEELAAKARSILDELYAADLAELSGEITARFAQGRAVKDLSDIARAATFGAISTLVVDMDHSGSGVIDETTGAIAFDEADDATNYGIIDEIVRRALLSGARVLVVRAEDVPGGGPAAANVRFAV